MKSATKSLRAKVFVTHQSSPTKVDRHRLYRYENNEGFDSDDYECSSDSSGDDNGSDDDHPNRDEEQRLRDQPDNSYTTHGEGD
jgi:hypothetical protein